MVRLVLFDIDGTLIYTRGAGVQAFARAFTSEFNAPHGTERMQFAGRTDTSLVREFFQLNQIAPSAENFLRFFDSYVFWLDHLLHQSSGGVLPGVWEFVRDLRTLSPRPAIGLLTGNIRLGAEIKLRRFDLWECFETGAFGDDHEDRDRLGFIARERGAALLRETLRGEQLLVVGDTPRDIQCARAVGARVLAAATGSATFEQLQAHQPDWLVQDLRAAVAQDLCR